MPFSIEQQLKLLGPNLFEELCCQVLQHEFPGCHHVKGEGGDEGLDIFHGNLAPDVRRQNGSVLRVWQVKFFRQGIKRSQRKQAEKSLDRVLMHHPDFWTLCVPDNFDPEALLWFEDLKQRYPNIIIDKMDAGEIVRRLHQPECQSLIDSYFLRQGISLGPEDLEKILTHLDDFSSVPKILEQLANYEISWDAEGFYNGALPHWRDIAQNFDAYRDKFGELWQFILTRANNPGRLVPFVLIVGRSGDGKSTLLMRLAKELSSHGHKLVFYHKGESNSLSSEQFTDMPPNSVAFILIDRITRFDADELKGFFERLYQHSIPAIVIGAAIRSLWNGLDLHLANVADVCEISLEKMTDNDIEALLDKLGAGPYLGNMAGLSREEQRARFQRKAHRQLLVALLEAKRNEKFETYIQGELDQLAERFKPYGVLVRRTCRYVSAFHRFDLPMPRSLLQRVLPQEVHIDDDILHCTKGLLTEVISKGENIITRHAYIAEVIFSLAGNQQKRYEEIIRAAEPIHEPLIGRVIHIMGLGDERPLAKAIFPIICEHFPQNIYFLHMQALLYQREGKFPKARELFRRASEISPLHAPVWQAWALLEQEQKNFGDWPDPQKYTARWLFQQGVAADPKNAPLWQAWALLEKDCKNFGDRDAPDEFTARQLFRQAVKIDPKNAPAWQAWAALEAWRGNLGDPDHPEQFTARWLFAKAAEVAPADPLSFTEWAKLEKKELYWFKAEGLWLAAARVDKNPDNRGRIYFDLAVMFSRLQGENARHKVIAYLERAIQENPYDAKTHAYLGLQYGYREEWEKSDRHFRESLRLDPNDRITIKGYNNMKNAWARWQQKQARGKS